MNIFKVFSREKRKSACAIGVIGGLDGPSAILVSKKRKLRKDDQVFLEYAATKLTADYRPFCEIESFLKDNCHAVPYLLSDKESELLKANVIMNHFRGQLNLPSPLGKNPTKKQLMEYARNDTSFEQARKFPAEKLGFIIKAYQIPSIHPQEILVELEMTTEYISVKNAPKELADALFTWQGVSQEDIDNKTQRFAAYAHVLRAAGKI